MLSRNVRDYQSTLRNIPEERRALSNSAEKPEIRRTVTLLLTVNVQLAKVSIYCLTSHFLPVNLLLRVIQIICRTEHYFSFFHNQRFTFKTKTLLGHCIMQQKSKHIFPILCLKCFFITQFNLSCLVKANFLHYVLKKSLLKTLQNVSSRCTSL